MAWRIDEQVIRGEIDSRTQGRTTGRIWLLGRDEPLQLDLEGNPWADLAGHLLHFSHPAPVPGEIDRLATEQRGSVGDITASRKLRVPECPLDEMLALSKAGKAYPWHWSNSLYLEWFSQRNGRVVIESTDFELTIDPEPAWSMSPDDEIAQRTRNASALSRFMDRLGAVTAGEALDDDAPQSKAEAEADAHTDWMNRLLDRIEARLEREGLDEADYESIYEEERARLQKETGYPPEPADDDETEEERQAWIDEMNAIAAEALVEMESEAWKERPEPRRPELLDRAMDLGIQLHADIEAWISEDSPAEHPLREIAWGVQFASVKIGGALGHDADEPWPPDPLMAGDSLVRLKKSRDCLRDALRAMDCADEESLATPEWRITSRRAIADILGEVQLLIVQLREVLKDTPEA